VTPTASSSFIPALARLRRIFWRRRLARGLVRSLWLALLSPTVALAVNLGWGRPIPWFAWLSGAALLGGAALGWALRPLSLNAMAQRLDRQLRAQSRLITALELSQQPAPAALNPVAEQLLRDATGLAVAAQPKVRFFNRGFWLEVQALAVVCMVLVALLGLDAFTADLPHVPPVELPPLPTATPTPTSNPTPPPAIPPTATPPPPSSSQSATDSPQPTAARPFAGDGQSLVLDSDSNLTDRVLQPATRPAQPGAAQAAGAPPSRQPFNSGGAAQADPLVYPWDKRDIIKRYFTPEQAH